jgi:ribosomal protein S27E
VNEIIKTIKYHLKDTMLEFVSFDEKGYIGRSKTHVILRCQKCGHINNFSYNYMLGNKIKCKHCENNGKFSHDKSVDLIQSKCKKLNYTFLSFLTEDGKYNGKHTYLVLKCNKCGNIWKTTTFGSFIQNTIKCMSCTNSWKMEKEVEALLKTNNIEYIGQCRNNTLPWLTNKISLSLDFYLPKYGIGIECQGKQHFEPVASFGGEKTFAETIKRDKKKLLLCKKHNVTLLYYDSEQKHQEFLGEKVFNNENELIKEITSYEQKN